MNKSKSSEAKSGNLEDTLSKLLENKSITRHEFWWGLIEDCFDEIRAMALDFLIRQKRLDRSQAEEICSDALVSLTKRFHGTELIEWEPRGDYISYLRTLIYNACRDVLDRMAARRAREKELMNDTKSLEDSFIDRLRDDELMESITYAMTLLSKKCRVILPLIFGGTMTQKEIAESLGIAEATVSKWKQRCFERLRFLVWRGDDVGSEDSQ